MAKNWWLKFEYRVWQSDPSLSQCSLGARGFWLEMLCAMHAQDVASITASYEQLGRIARCESSEVAKYVVELKDTKTADVTLGHGLVTLKSRRFHRELSTKESNRLRKEKQRVTAKSQHIVNSKEVMSKKEEEKEAVSPPTTPENSVYDSTLFEYPVRNLIEAFPQVNFQPTHFGFIEAEVGVSPTDRAAWLATIQIYQQNYDPLTKTYLPTKVGNLLGVFRREKTRIEREEKYATSKPNGKRTDADVFAESAEFYKHYDEQPIA